jgi:hypothetical protein
MRKPEDLSNSAPRDGYKCRRIPLGVSSPESLGKWVKDTIMPGNDEPALLNWLKNYGRESLPKQS